MEVFEKKRIIAIVFAFLLVVAIGFRFYKDYKNKDVPVVSEKKSTVDSLKFKKEYEDINGTKSNSDKEYLTLNINEVSSIVYKSDKEIVDIMENGTGIIYFGFNTCPWCRSIVEVLMDVVAKNSIDDFYYVDIKDIRSSYEVKDKKLVKTKEGSSSYYRILDKLSDNLDDYKLTSNKKSYDTKEKRLYAPTVVAIKNGEVVGFHEGTVETQKDPYLGLNEDEKVKLTEIYSKLVKEIVDVSCNDKAGC